MFMLRICRMELGGAVIAAGWGRRQKPAVSRNVLLLLLLARLGGAETQALSPSSEPDTETEVEDPGSHPAFLGEAAIGLPASPSSPQWVDQSRLQAFMAAPFMTKVQLSCKVTGSPEPNIRWTKDGLDIEVNDSVRQDFFDYYRVKPQQQMLVITQLMQAHEGRYTCIVSNKWGSIQHTFTVEGLEHFHDAPRIIEKPINQTVVVGMDAHLKCVVDSGSLVPAIHWVKIIAFENYEPFRKYQNKEELVLRNVTKKNEGTYACVIISNAGKTMATARLEVLEDYEAIEQPPENITSAPGTSVNFHCKTPLAVRPYITWVKLLEGEADMLVLAEQTEVLTLTNITETDAGLYACTIGTNSHNTFWETAYLTVTELDPQLNLVTPLTAATKLIVIVVCVSALAVVLVVVI